VCSAWGKREGGMPCLTVGHGSAAHLLEIWCQSPKPFTALGLI
jgi:hypothetical protein